MLSSAAGTAALVPARGDVVKPAMARSSCSSGPEVRMMARSMTFCSSRTLPGQS